MANGITFTVPDQVEPEELAVIPERTEPLFQPSQFIPPPLETAETPEFVPPALETAEAVPAAPPEDISLPRSVVNLLQRGTSRGVFSSARGTVNFLRNLESPEGIARREQSQEDAFQAFSESGFADNPLGRAWIAFGKKVRETERSLREGLTSADETLKGAQRMDILNLPVDEEFAATKIGQIIEGVGQAGSSVAFWGLPGVGQIVGPMSAAGQIYQEAFDDAELTLTERNVTENLGLTEDEIRQEAHLAGMSNAPSAAMEILGERFVFGPILKAFKGKVKVKNITAALGRMFAAGAVEGTTETAQQAWLNTVASKIRGYDPERVLDDELIDSLVIGAAVGFLTAGVGESTAILARAEDGGDGTVEALEQAETELGEAAAAEQELQVEASKIGSVAVEEVTELDLTDPDAVAAHQRAITDEANQVIEEIDTVQEIAIEASQTKDEIESAQIEAIEIGSGKSAEEAGFDAAEGTAKIVEAGVQGAEGALLETIGDTLDPVTAIERKFPEAAAAQQEAGDQLAGQFLVELENPDGTTAPALFAGYWTEDVPAIGHFVPETGGFSHGALQPGQTIVSTVPTFQEWADLQESALADADITAPPDLETAEAPPAEVVTPAEIPPTATITPEPVPVTSPEPVAPVETVAPVVEPVAPIPTAPLPVEREVTPLTVDELAVEELRDQARNARKAQTVRRLAKVGLPADGNPDLLNEIQDFGGVPAASRDSTGGEYDGFREAFQGTARFLVVTDSAGSKFGAGGIDTWLQEFEETTGRQFESIDDFYAQVFNTQARRKGIQQQVLNERKVGNLEAALLGNEKKRKKDRTTRPINTSTLAVGDRFKVDQETFIVADVLENGDVIIQDGITHRLADGTEIFPDKKSVRRVARDVSFLSPEDEAALAAEEAAEPTPAPSPVETFTPPLLSTAEPTGGNIGGGESVPIAAPVPAEPLQLAGQTEEEIATDAEQLAVQQQRAAQAEELAARQQAPLTPTAEQIDVGQGELLTGDETLFSGPALEAQDPGQLAETAAEYATRLEITDPARRVGAEGYAVEVVNSATEEGRGYVEAFLETGEVTPEIRAQLAEGQRISAVLASHVNGTTPTFNIDGQTIRTTQDFVSTQLALRSPYQESIKVAFLDGGDKVVHSGIISMGELAAADISTAMIAKEFAVAQTKGAETPRLLISHNHPSGNTDPSNADRAQQAIITDFLEGQGGELIDFVVTNGDDYYSSSFDLKLPLVEPNRAPWEAVPASQRRRINNVERTSDLVSSLRQGNPEAEFIVYTDTRLGITGVEQVAPDSSVDQWIAQATEGATATGANSVTLATSQPAETVQAIQDGLASNGTNVTDASTNTSRSMFEEGKLREGNIQSRPASLAEEQGEFEFREGVERAASPYDVVQPPPPPPPSVSTETGVKEVIRDTGTAPDSAVKLTQNFPASEIAQWVVSDPSPQDRESIDAEGVALLQNSPEQMRFFVPTEVFGTPMSVLGRRGDTPNERLRSTKRAARVFREAGLDVEFDPKNEVFRLTNPTQSNEEGGLALIDILKRELALGSGDGRPLLSVIINSVRNPDGGLWVSTAFSQNTRNRLFSLAQAEASFYGLMLGALARNKRSLNFVSQHVDVYLHTAYAKAFGGEELGEVMDRVRREASDIATDSLDNTVTPEMAAILNRLDSMSQQGVDLDFYMGEVLDQISRGERSVTPRPEIQQLPSLFDLANWRLFITQRGGNRIAQNILRMINGEETQDNDGPEEGNVKRMDRLLQTDLNQIVKEVIPQIEQERQEPNFLQDLLTASGDLQTRTERLDVVDAQVRQGLDAAEQTELDDENADPDEVAEKFTLLREKWDEQFTQISGTLSSDAMVRRILNQHLNQTFEQLDINWQDVAAGRATVENVRRNVMQNVEQSFNEFNQQAPEAAIDPERSQRLLDLLQTGFDDLASKKVSDIRARKVASDARRKAELPQRTAESELNRLAQIHSDVQQWTVPEENAVRDAITAQRANPASPEIFEQTLISVGVREQTANTLSRIINRDIDVRRRHEQLGRERRVASPRPERGPVEEQERKTGIKGLVDRIFAAPPQQQNDPRWQQRTALEYFQENGLTEAEAQDAWNHFKTDFKQLLRQAAVRGLNQMRQNLSRREATMLNRRTRGVQLFERLEKAVNAGVFDQESILKEFAAEFGWDVPSEAQVETLKALATREQELGSLTEDERARIGDDPAALEEARLEKAAATLPERLRLQNRMHSLYAQFSRPITMRTSEGRRNLGEAGREFISANMLLKLGFGVKQVIDVGTQWAVHTPLRAIAFARQRHQEALLAGEPTEFYTDAARGISEALGNIGTFASQSSVQWLQAMRGEGVRRNIEGMRSTISGFDRMGAEVRRLEGEIATLRNRGDLNSLNEAADKATKGFILRVMGLAEGALRFTRAMDNIQGVFVEQQEIRERLISELIRNEQFKSPAEARAKANEILGDWRREQDLNLFRAGEIAANNGITPSANELQAMAYEIYKSRQYSRIKGASLDANMVEENVETQRQTVGWNMPEETGIGGAVGVSVRALARQIERLGIPLPLGQFSNAIAIGINKGLTWTPLGFFPSAFGGIEQGTDRGNNAWFRTPEDRQLRKFEATIGTATAGIFTGLMASGLIRVWIRPPDDPEEREIWKKEGHRAGTVEFFAGRGKFVPVSLTSGPMSLFRVPLTAIGAVQDMFDSSARRRGRIEAEAASKGVPVGEIPDLTMGDIGAAASLGAFTAIMGGRTAGGALRSLKAGTERDLPTLQTSTAAQLSPFVVGLPAYQEMQRTLETRIDRDRGNIVDMMFPTQGSDKRMFNFLSDELGPGFTQQATQVLTGGSFGVVDPDKLDEDNAYRIFRQIQYRPSRIERAKGVFINGQIRPLTDEEYAKAQFLRGQLLKDSLADVDPNQDPRVLTRFASKFAEVTKKQALQAIRAEDVTLGNIEAREQMPDEARTLFGEINSLPAGDRAAAFQEALAEGRVPLLNGDIHPVFMSEWRKLTTDITDPATP